MSHGADLETEGGPEPEEGHAISFFTSPPRHRLPQKAIITLSSFQQRQAAGPPNRKPPDPLRPTSMVTAVSAAAVVDLCLAFVALDILSFLDPQLGADPSTQAVELLLPLAALGALVTAAVAIYRHLQHSAAASGAAGSRRLCPLFAILCASVGTLEFFFFVQPAGPGVGGVGDAGAQARALGLAAARVLPAAAAATFFLGMALIIVAHVRAGGEGGGGYGADGHVQGGVSLSFLTKTAFAAAAALVWLMALALYGEIGIY